MTVTFDPSAGIYLKGVPVDDNTFLAAVQFRQLRAVTRDPLELQISATSGRDDADLQSERAVHDLVQRAVTGKKRQNVGAYADYIVGILKGGVGVLPPIHLWTENALDTFPMDAGTFALVPLGENLISIDGETQLTGHYRIAKAGRDLYDATIKDLHNRMTLSVVVHHGVETRVARQYFHDLNILAVKPNVGIGLAMDTSDPIMRIVGDVESLPMLASRVEHQARQLAKRSDKLVTLAALRQMVINIALGMPGIQYGARPAPVTEEQLEQLARLAPKVVATYFTAFTEVIQDREHYMASTGPVLAAVGAMAEPLLKLTDHGQDVGIDQLMSGLRQVHWERDDTWQGIAGDFTSRGVFSVKGTKEVSYAVLNALSDPRNPSYHRVRHGAADRPPAPAAQLPSFAGPS